VDYRVEPTRLARRTSRFVLAVTATAVVIAVVVGAVALSVGNRPEPSPLGIASPVAGASVAIASASAAAPVVPPEIRCHDVESPRCAQVARAALDAAADPSLPRPLTVDVWASLLCGSSFDCPPYRLVGRRPAGSAVVGFATSRVLWVNITEVVEVHPLGATDLKLDAWVIRSGSSR
jgi:hypothetical protein